MANSKFLEQSNLIFFVKILNFQLRHFVKEENLLDKFQHLTSIELDLRVKATGEEEEVEFDITTLCDFPPSQL